MTPNNNDQIARELLEQYTDAVAVYDAAVAPYQELIAEIEAQRDAAAKGVKATVEAIKAQVGSIVLSIGYTAQGGSWQAIYVGGRLAVDSARWGKLLTEHPDWMGELSKAVSVGKPSVRLAAWAGGRGDKGSGE